MVALGECLHPGFITCTPGLLTSALSRGHGPDAGNQKAHIQEGTVTMATMQITAEPRVPQIVITSEHEAPSDLLFRAYTEPELLAQWLGPRRLTMTVGRMDVRDGGTWRYTHLDADGSEYAFHGVYHGTPSPDRIVQTFEFEGTPGHVSLETITFEEDGAKTLVRQSSIFQSVEDRDAELQSGMEQGARDSVERLDELISMLAPVG